MNLARLLGLLAIIWVLYVVISAPAHAADLTHGVLADLRTAGDRAIEFANAVVR